jgi:hypothetical protein
MDFSSTVQIDFRKQPQTQSYQGFYSVEGLDSNYPNKGVINYAKTNLCGL